MKTTQKISMYVGVAFLYCLTLSTTTPANATDLLTCVHKTGAIVYTRTPGVLGDQFNCAGKRAAAEAANSYSRNEKLDPTPNRSEANLECPSTATIKIDSSDYGGQFIVELRRGTRPGSKRISGNEIGNGDSVGFQHVCPGTYFYAFGPTDSDDVSVTRNFTVTNDGTRYNNPVITVFYSRATHDGSKRLEKTRKNNL